MRRASLLVTFLGAFASLTAAMATVGARSAHADSLTADWWTNVQLDTVRLAPMQLDVDTAQFGSRTLTGRLPSAGSTTMLGGSWSFGVTLDHHFRLPLVSLGAAFAVGSYHEQLTSFDGSFLHQRPWATSQFDMTIGGFGYTANARRWSFSASILPGFSIIAGGASASYGNDTYELDPSRTFFLVRAELAACRRLDPLERVCAVLAPNVYQDGFFQGGSLSLRYEVGR